ncbi:MAG: hypothetical protein AAGF12_13215 [Myxococcota bacterium]
MPPPPMGDGIFGCPTAPAPDYTGTRGLPAEWTDAVRAEVRDIGIEAWRLPDEAGQTCADCHGVDGLDLAVFAFTDEDLRRRGGDHVPDQSVEAVVDLVHLHRADLNIASPCTLDSRVLQPGGDVLPGNTVIGREVAFTDVLHDLDLLVIEEEQIDTVAEAERVFQELVDTDVRRVPLPIPFPRWSDDHARGEQYRNINDWITDDAMIPRDSERTAWYALHDQYIADPSEEHLFAIIAAMEGSIRPKPLQERPDMTRMMDKLADHRYISALFAQHFFRHELEGKESWLDYGINAFDLRYTMRPRPAGDHSVPGVTNPFSNLVIGDQLPLTNCHPDANEATNRDVSIDCLRNISEGMREELSTSESIWDYDALGSYSPTWGTMAWLWDSSQMRHNKSGVMKYWKQDIRRLDYHLLYTWMWATTYSAKWQEVESVRGPYRPAPDPITPHLVDGDWWRHYHVTRVRDIDDDATPGRDARNAMVYRMTVNMHTASLLLLERHLEEGATVNLPSVLRSELEGAYELIRGYPVSESGLDFLEALHQRVLTGIDAAPSTEVRTIYS